MEEIKELLVHLSEGAAFESEIATLRKLLLIKQAKISEQCYTTTVKEATEMIDLLAHKQNCFDEWQQLFPESFQLAPANTDK